jgi:threonine dehydrogenase-like Zn-dependent dehydrogenase
MECFFCQHGWTSRCDASLLFGSPRLDGAQAQYVRVPTADGTVIKAPTNVPKNTLVLMADIFPTGYFGAKNAFRMLDPMDPKEATVVVIGCGPVGLCAIISALEYKPKHLFAIDGVDSRLELAKSLGAQPLNYLTGNDAMLKTIMEASGGRGADAVVEVVGMKGALRTAYDVIRPWGVISSIGVHNSEVSARRCNGPIYGNNSNTRTDALL